MLETRGLLESYKKDVADWLHLIEVNEELIEKLRASIAENIKAITEVSENIGRYTKYIEEDNRLIKELEKKLAEKCEV